MFRPSCSMLRPWRRLPKAAATIVPDYVFAEPTLTTARKTKLLKFNKDFSNLSGEDDNAWLPRSHGVSPLMYLRACTTDEPEPLTEAQITAVTLDEVRANNAAGLGRWGALSSGAQVASKLDACFTMELIEAFNIYLGYAQTAPFVFSVPPSLHGNKKKWTFKEVLVAAAGRASKKAAKELEHLEVTPISGLLADMKKTLDEAEEQDDEETFAEMKTAFTALQKGLESLPCAASLQRAHGELTGNCDTTVDFVFVQDATHGIVAGCYIQKAW